MLLFRIQNENRKLVCVHICFDKKQFSYYIIYSWTCGGREVFFTKWWSILRLFLIPRELKRPSQFGCQDQWYYVKTCTAGWQCDETLRGGGDTRGAANIARIMQRTRSGKCVRLKMCVIIVEEQYLPPLDPDGWCHPHCATTSPLPPAGISLISTAMSWIYKKYFFSR